MVKHAIRYEVATNDYQRHTIRFHDNIDIRLGQGNHYAVDLDGLDYFVNDNVPNLFEEKQEPYTGLDNMLDIHEYVNNSADEDA